MWMQQFTSLFLILWTFFNEESWRKLLWIKKIIKLINIDNNTTSNIHAILRSRSSLIWMVESSNKRGQLFFWFLCALFTFCYLLVKAYWSANMLVVITLFLRIAILIPIPIHLLPWLHLLLLLLALIALLAFHMANIN